MSFNENLKEISIIEVLCLIIVAYGLVFALNFFDIIKIDTGIVNLFILFYFIFKLKDFLPDLKEDASNLFSEFTFADILVIVLINICFSYGMFYLSKGIITLIPSDLFSFIPKSIDGVLGIFSFISIVLISPIVEELIFRGVFLNKLKLIVPTAFAILVSSLLFASLHGFGSIFSAFIFAVCMALLYLKSDNILLPIFAHFLNNLIGESVYHIDSGKLLFTNGIVMGTMSVLAIVSFILILKFIRVHMKNI